MMETLVPWIDSYGLFAIVGLLMIGIVGLPIPDETLLAYAGVLAAQGHWPLSWVLAAGVAGSWCGVTASYLLGRAAGGAILARLSEHHGRVAHRVAATRAWFDRIGKWLLTAAYFIPAVRHLAALMAGAVKVPMGMFIIFAYPGGVVWATAFVLLGFWLGKAWVRETVTVHRVLLSVAAGAAVLGGIIYLVRRRLGRTAKR